MHELQNTLLSVCRISLGTFKSTVDNILQKHAPIKEMCSCKSSFIHQ